MRKQYLLTLVTCISIVIIISLLPVFFTIRSQPIQIKHFPSITSIPPERIHDLQVIHTSSESGKVLCTDDDPGVCENSQEGKVLEYNMGCNGLQSSASLYICKSGRWVYIDWTDHSFCQFCKK